MKARDGSSSEGRKGTRSDREECIDRGLNQRERNRQETTERNGKRRTRGSDLTRWVKRNYY